MTEQPSITIIFDPATRIPNTVLINGAMDTETAMLREIADQMVGAIMEGGDVHAE
jgi:hypothetical protein